MAKLHQEAIAGRRQASPRYCSCKPGGPRRSVPRLDASAAAAVFNSAIRPGEQTSILHVHKGEIAGKTCHARADALIVAQGGTPGWQEMTDHLICLPANSGFTADQVVEDALREGSRGEGEVRDSKQTTKHVDLREEGLRTGG